MASTSTSGHTSKVAILLLVAAAVVVNCRQLDARRDNFDLLEPLISATRRQHAGHLTLADDKRSWRKNRVRVWGKRSPIDDDETDKRTWHENTVRVWGKRQGAPTANRRAWAGNTIRVWGKRHSLGGPTPEQVLKMAAARYGSAPKRSSGGSEAHISKLSEQRPARFTAEPVVDVGTLTDNDLMTRSSQSGTAYHHHGGHGSGRSVVRRAAVSRPRWVAFRGPKRSWRMNVIRVWGKRAI